jgi:Icc-related predicted phosphoesterase
LLADSAWEFSTDGGATWSATPAIVPGNTQQVVQVRACFVVDRLGDWAALELTHPFPTNCRTSLSVNGHDVPLPDPEMQYRTIPAIPPGLLAAGENQITLAIDVYNYPPANDPTRVMKDIAFKAKPGRLAALEPRHTHIRTGPVLGPFGRDYFTVSCRTQTPMLVSLYRIENNPVLPNIGNLDQPVAPPSTGMTFVAGSPTGLSHRFRVQGAPETIKGDYLLLAGGAAQEKRVMTFRAPAAIGSDFKNFRFIAMGDCRTNFEDWRDVAAAALLEKPEAVVFTGDMVSWGRNEWLWDEEFFTPAAPLLSAVPILPVLGNHEADAPLFDQMFISPGDDAKAHNWAQAYGGVLIIGVDGAEDWSEGSENARWLERTLEQAASSKFVFLATHYPGYSTSMHGANDLLDPTHAREWMVDYSRHTILPLLAKYHATAMLCGHDHCYERSEIPGDVAPPAGITQIIAGGAGAPQYQQSKQPAEQNPYVTVFVNALSYCVIDVAGDTCTLRAVSVDGKELDRRTWQARTAGTTTAPASP